ncbi:MULTISPECIES: Crp/Fnr family transcriptional regulator [Rhizobium]|uniref:CRP/FNR family transcriptional regulator n=1 Tax=Rhizobium paranaense TaxID=1650438 RepID=A0A7W8XVV2_9HYPH|nr:helix-turn-helix domain-containing protein [Rhizobium paranaense]MBB5576548.1 CRP/FNR family transcriptional regulator [Rhizobium paranaense]
MLMQRNQAFDHAEVANEAITIGQQPLASVFQTAPTETVEAGKALCWEGDAVKHFFHIQQGVVRLHRIIGEGRRAVTGFHFAGDVIGAFLQDDFLFTAEAVTDCKVRRISRKSFHEEVVRSESLRPEYINLLCRETMAAHDQMVLLSKKNAEERLCSFIMTMANRRGTTQKGLLHIPMNRQDIADYLGMTIETVSRTISKLALRNVVASEGRHDLRILSFSRLQQLSGNADDFSAETCHRMSVH